MNESEAKARVQRAQRICEAHGITQADIAAKVGASQSQVSRILQGRSVKASRLFEEVCLFVERFDVGVTADVVRANNELIDALKVTWDGSAAHAKALAVIIRSLKLLGPVGQGRRPYE